MKLQINLTDSSCDMERFRSAEELRELLKGFDGIELMHLEEDTRGIITPEMVVGYHMSLPEYWLDFWRDDQLRVEREFDTLERAHAYYGGNGPEALVRAVQREYENAVRLGAEYMVFHVSDAGAWEEMTGRYYYTDREVIDGACELLNAALPAQTCDERKTFNTQHAADRQPATENKTECRSPLLLMENLWQPGLRLTDPVMTERLLTGVQYPWRGIMLDTGHLMHTNPSLRSQKEAVAYIHQILDAHGALCRSIRGIHWNQSLTGTVMRRYQKHPPQRAETYEERMNQLFTYVFQVDLHRPFTGDGARELIQRIAPEYLTYEFISSHLEEHRRMLRRQQKALL